MIGIFTSDREGELESDITMLMKRIEELEDDLDAHHRLVAAVCEWIDHRGPNQAAEVERLTAAIFARETFK